MSQSRFTFVVAPARVPPGVSAAARFRYFIATVGPCGLSPWAPGTVASLVTALVCWWLQPRGLALDVCALGIFLFGVWASTGAEQLLNDHDPRCVVVDEVLGQLLAFLFVAPAGWLAAAAGFALFRLFDVLKPFPIARLERLPAGWGIMADDALAGCYAALVLLALRQFHLL